MKSFLFWAVCFCANSYAAIHTHSCAWSFSAGIAFAFAFDSWMMREIDW